MGIGITGGVTTIGQPNRTVAGSRPAEEPGTIVKGSGLSPENGQAREKAYQYVKSLLEREGEAPGTAGARAFLVVHYFFDAPEMLERFAQNNPWTKADDGGGGYQPGPETVDAGAGSLGAEGEPVRDLEGFKEALGRSLEKIRSTLDNRETVEQGYRATMETDNAHALAHDLPPVSWEEYRQGMEAELGLLENLEGLFATVRKGLETDTPPLFESREWVA